MRTSSTRSRTPATRRTSTRKPAGGAAAGGAYNVGHIPSPWKSPQITLADVVGAGKTTSLGKGALKFHAVGDTGSTGREETEIALAMARDYREADAPAFFLHLGDILYGLNKEAKYVDEFYRPYDGYPGPIIAIPGNHDGEIKSGTDPVSLAAFWKNFCDRNPTVPHSVSQTGVNRKTMDLPGVYWHLTTPQAEIFGLYSNYDETFGYLEGRSQTAAAYDMQQVEWLGNELNALGKTKQKKALIFAMHHPPYSAGGHTGSEHLVETINDLCTKAGVVPHLFLAGHAHNYQRYTRLADGARFIVAGMGGHGKQTVKPATNQVINGIRFESSLEVYGYLLVTVDAKEITVEMRVVETNGRVSTADHTSIPLGGGK